MNSPGKTLRTSEFVFHVSHIAKILPLFSKRNGGGRSENRVHWSRAKNADSTESLEDPSKILWSFAEWIDANRRRFVWVIVSLPARCRSSMLAVSRNRILFYGYSCLQGDASNDPAGDPMNCCMQLDAEGACAQSLICISIAACSGLDAWSQCSSRIVCFSSIACLSFPFPVAAHAPRESCYTLFSNTFFNSIWMNFDQLHSARGECNSVRSQ